MDIATLEKKQNIELGFESARWVVVNTLMCQLPVFIMYLQGFGGVDILYSGLSYAITLLIVANYTLDDFRFKGLKKASLVGWLLFCVSFVAVYKSIANENLKLMIIEHIFFVYLAFIIISNILAYYACMDQLKENSREILMGKINEKKIKADKTREDLDRIKGEIVIDEEDM